MHSLRTVRAPVISQSLDHAQTMLRLSLDYAVKRDCFSVTISIQGDIYIDSYVKFQIWNLYHTTIFIQGDIYIDSYVKFLIWYLYHTTISIQGDIYIYRHLCGIPHLESL